MLVRFHRLPISPEDRSEQLWPHQPAQPGTFCDADAAGYGDIATTPEPVGRAHFKRVGPRRVEPRCGQCGITLKTIESIALSGREFLELTGTSIPLQRRFSALIPTSIRPDLLKHKLQRKLHLARRIRLKDIVECRRTDVAVGQMKVRAVQDVKQLRAELYMR
jgi:hypothetical protein